MIEAFLWGGIAASSLLIGSLLALRLTIPRRTVGLIMGFGAGVLLSAVAYDLVLDATLTETRHLVVFLGLLIGASSFSRKQISRAPSPRIGEAAGQTQSAGGMALILGAVLDGIPESIVLGLTLIGGEGDRDHGAHRDPAVESSRRYRRDTRPRRVRLDRRPHHADLDDCRRRVRVCILRGVCRVRERIPRYIAFVQGFAGGAIIAMLTDSMIPEAYENGGNLVGLVTAVGFAMAFGLTLLEWIP